MGAGGQLLTPQASPRGDAGRSLGVSPIPEETSDPQQQAKRSQLQLVVPTNASNQSLVRSEPSRQKGNIIKLNLIMQLLYIVPYSRKIWREIKFGGLVVYVTTTKLNPPKFPTRI